MVHSRKLPQSQCERWLPESIGFYKLFARKSNRENKQHKGKQIPILTGNKGDKILNMLDFLSRRSCKCVEFDLHAESVASIFVCCVEMHNSNKKTKTNTVTVL